MEPSRCTCRRLPAECDRQTPGSLLCPECAQGCRSWGVNDDGEWIYHYKGEPGWRARPPRA